MQILTCFMKFLAHLLTQNFNLKIMTPKHNSLLEGLTVYSVGVSRGRVRGCLALVTGDGDMWQVTCDM